MQGIKSAGKLATVRALLAKAADPAATEAEADAYNQKAAQLIAQYGIDVAMLDEPTDEIGRRTIQITNPYALEWATLLSVIAREMRGELVLITHTNARRQKSYTAILYGFGSDMDAIELLYTSLMLQASTGLSRAYVPSYLAASAKAAHKRSWLQGFAYIVQERLRAANAAAVADTASGSSVELVLVNRQDRVKAYAKQEHGDLKERKRKLSGRGFGDGMDAGHRANLGTDASVAGTRRKQI